MSANLVRFFFRFHVKLSKRLADIVGSVAVDKLAVAVADDDHRGFLSVGGGVAHAQRIQRRATCCKLSFALFSEKNRSPFRESGFNEET